MIKCDICGFMNPDGHLYCGRCGSGVSLQQAHSEADIDTAIEGERKQVTVIFADISGFTALNDAAQTPAQVEQVLHIVNHSLSLLSEIVYDYDGYIDKFMGDAIMALFGAPVTHENDPERALRAVLDMMRALEAFNHNPPYPLAEPLGIHMGINTGTVIAGIVGTSRKRSYTVMGDVVNVASRLESVSERGEILVSEATYQLTKKHFIFKKRDPVQVKGKKEALVIYELIGERTQTSEVDFSTALIGRSHELNHLLDHFNRLKQAQGGVISIVGEAGLGKSRLLGELQHRFADPNNDIRWLEGRGLSYRQNMSYQLFIEIMRQYLEAEPDTVNDVLWQRWQLSGKDLFGERSQELIPYLAMLMGIKLNEQYTQNLPLSEPMVLQQRMFTAVGEWLEELATQSSLVLVFEDLHWADPNSVHLIEYLMSLTPFFSLLVICISRPEHESEFWQVHARMQAESEDTKIAYQVVDLNPLNQEESQSLLANLLDIDAVSQKIALPILNRTEGNPLFMEEVVKSLVEDGTLARLDGEWQIASTLESVDIEQKIPNTLTGVLTARIDRLGDAVKRTLQIAAVIGRTFPRSVLQAVLEERDNLDDQLTLLIVSGLIHKSLNEAETSYTFKHALTHETVYNNLLLQQRRIYHRKIADYMAPWYYLRGEEYASVIAHHYVQGEAWDRALKYLLRAADASRNTFDNDNAVHFYDRALTLAISLDDTAAQAEIYAGRGKILKRLGQVDQARADFEGLLALAEKVDDLTHHQQALIELGKLRAGSPQFSQASAYFEKALAIARQTNNESGLIDALNELGEFEFNMGRLDKSKTLYEEALSLAQKQGRTQLTAPQEDGLAAIALYEGNLRQSIQSLEVLVRTWRDIGNHQGLLNSYLSLATAYTLQGNYEASNQICADAELIYERIGDQNWLPPLKTTVARNNLAQGNISAALTQIEEAVQTASKLVNGLWHSVSLSQAVFAYLILGQHEQARSAMEEAIALAQTAGSPLWLVRAKIFEAQVLRHEGQFAQAKTILEAQRDTIQILGFIPDEIHILLELLEVYVLLNHWEQIDTCLLRLNELLDQTGISAYQAQAFQLLAQQAIYHKEYAQALDYLHKARAYLAASENTLAQIYLPVLEAAVHKLLGDEAQADSLLVQAQGKVDDIAKTLKQSWQTAFSDKHLNAIQTLFDNLI